MPGDLPDHTEALRNVGALEAAEQRAFERGQQSAKLKAQVDSHERRLNAINGSISRHADEARNLAETVTKLGEDFRTSVAVATARAVEAKEAAKEAAERQVSTRTFVFGLLGAVAAISSVLAATGHA